MILISYFLGQIVDSWPSGLEGWWTAAWATASPSTGTPESRTATASSASSTPTTTVSKMVRTLTWAVWSKTFLNGSLTLIINYVRITIIHAISLWALLLYQLFFISLHKGICLGFSLRSSNYIRSSPHRLFGKTLQICRMKTISVNIMTLNCLFKTSTRYK